MSFWIGFSESFKPTKLVELYFELSEKKRKEELETAEKVEKMRQAQLFGQTVIKNIEDIGKQYNIDVSEQIGAISNLLPQLPDYQTVSSTASYVQNVLNKKVEQAEDLRKEKLKAEKDAQPKLEGHYFDDQNRVVGIFNENGNYKVAHITDQYGNYITRNDNAAERMQARAEKFAEELKDVTDYAVGIMGSWGTSAVEVQAPAFAKFLEKKEVFLSSKEGQALLRSELANKIADDIRNEKETKNVKVSKMINKIKQAMPNASNRERAKMLMAVSSILQLTENFSIE